MDDFPPLSAGHRLDHVQQPIIAHIGELIRAHPGTISLGQGVVFYPPPPQALETMHSGLQQMHVHKYGATQGLHELRYQLAEKLQRENRIDIDNPARILVTAGSNMGFYYALLAITNPGDEIILLLPYYFNHEMAINMLGCRPLLVACTDSYQIDLDALRRAISPQTRAIVTISPNNPTGVVYAAETLCAVNDLCRNHGIYHISDEAYEYFTYDGAVHFSPASLAQAQAHTISVFSLSKAYGFASWRIGYLALPPQLSDVLDKIQDTILICAPLVCQYAALGALQAGSAYCRLHIGQIAANRRTMLSHLEALDSLIDPPHAEGAFYILLRVHIGLSSLEVAQRLIREHGVAVIPGSAFGMDQGCYLRIAYGALEQHSATEGIERLVRGLKALADPAK